MSIERTKPEVSTAIVLENRVIKKDGTHPVRLRITFERKQKYYTIKNYSYTESDFDKIFSRKPRADYKEKRKFLEKIEDKAIDIIDKKLDEFTFEGFEYEFLKKTKIDNTIQSFFNNKIEELNSNGKLQTEITYNAALKSLTEFEPKLNFNKINPKFLKEYEKWMIKNGRTYTTVAIYLRNLRHIINLAIEKGLVLQKNYPFGNKQGKYKIPVGSNFKKALSLSDIEKIFNYKAKSMQEEKAQAFWIFSYLCNGMNMADIANLKYRNIQGDNITYLRLKTIDTTHDKKEIVVPIIPDIKNIIKKYGNEKEKGDDYIFPIYQPELSEREKLNLLKQHIKNTNKYMKRIAENVGINAKLTTYWARHSFSTILKRSGAPTEYISEQLGHSSIKVTKSYLDSFEDETRREWATKLTQFTQKSN